MTHDKVGLASDAEGRAQGEARGKELVKKPSFLSSG